MKLYIALNISSCSQHFTSPALSHPDVDCQGAASKGSDYTGTVAVTETGKGEGGQAISLIGAGKTCQSWAASTQHEHLNTPHTLPSLGEHNFCG